MCLYDVHPAADLQGGEKKKRKKEKKDDVTPAE